MKRLFVVLSLCLASSAYANVLYSNGPVDGTTGAYFLDFRTVSDQFNPSGSTMTGFDIALWVSPGSVPVQFDWRVGTLPFDGSLGSATAIIGRGVTASLLCTSGSSYNGGICGRNNDFDIYWVSVTTSAITVGNGDWLTLGNGGDSSGLGIAWDVNSGPSPAAYSSNGAIPSESFDITGQSAVLEPGTSMLLAGGFLGLAALLRRKRIAMRASNRSSQRCISETVHY